MTKLPWRYRHPGLLNDLWALAAATAFGSLTGLLAWLICRQMALAAFGVAAFWGALLWGRKDMI